jgi:hypothetical protein
VAKLAAPFFISKIEIPLISCENPPKTAIARIEKIATDIRTSIKVKPSLVILDGEIKKFIMF